MNNKIKNIIAFSITVVFIISGVFLVYKTEGNVIGYYLENISQKNENIVETINNETNINKTDIKNNIKIKEPESKIIIESETIKNSESSNLETNEDTTESSTKANESNNQKENNELELKNISTNSNTNTIYRKTYLDPTNPDIMHVIDGNYDKSFFKNTLFVGDSRVDGLKLYANVPEAHYFCSTGLNEYTLFKEPIVVPDVGNIYLEFLVATNKYDRIYFQMGINSLGSNFKSHVREYGNAVKKLRELSPSSKIYIVSNMHVVKRRNDESKYITNANIDLFNNEIKRFADNKDIFYIDVNPFLDDEKTGILNEEYTRDGVHLLPKYYDIEMDVFYNYSRQ